MLRRIVYTRFDGGVDVCCPSPVALAAMQSGGYWDHMPRGFVKTQIERQIADGIGPDAARRFAHALAYGGHTEAEAWDIIAERDCRHRGTALDLIDVGDLPDRWFRDAWRRGANGGPISIDMPHARKLQWWKLQEAAEAAKKDWEPRFGDVNWGAVKDRIRSASSERELRSIWIEGL